MKLVPRTSAVVEPLDPQFILDRRTSRLPYDGRPVSQAVLDELSAISKRYGHELEFSNETAQVNWVVRLNADTMFFDMSEQVPREEVASWMRFSRRSARRRADGLAAYAMHFPGMLMWLFVKLNWAFRLPGIYHLVRNFYERSMRGTATVAWVSGPFDTQNDWDNAGRMMARLWLTMTKHGVYLHPFGSVITNPKAHALMVDHFKSSTRQHDLWMLVRLGYSAMPPKAQRLPLEHMVLNLRPAYIDWSTRLASQQTVMNEEEMLLQEDRWDDEREQARERDQRQHPATVAACRYALEKGVDRTVVHEMYGDDVLAEAAADLAKPSKPDQHT